MKVTKRKMTVEKFNEHYMEYVRNFKSKYNCLDLNFKESMFMKGLSEDEFDVLIKQI